MHVRAECPVFGGFWWDSLIPFYKSFIFSSGRQRYCVLFRNQVTKKLFFYLHFVGSERGGGGSNGHHTGVGNFMKYQESCEQYLLEVHKKKSQRLKKFSAHKHFRFVHVKKGLLKIRLESKQILSRKRQKWYHSWTKLTFVH